MKRTILILMLAGCTAETGLTRPDLALAQVTEKPAKTEGECWAEAGSGWIATPCADQMTPEVTASLQRALAARKLYDGEADGKTGTATKTAIRQYQAPLGFDSPILTLEAARSLGILPTPM